MDNKKPLDAPIGEERIVMTPWGSTEKCNVFKMSRYSGKEEYASVYRPSSKPYVRYSVFRLR